MRTILFLLAFAFSGLVHAVACHTTPSLDDRQFYDKALVSAATQLTWGGQAANNFAAATIYRRRISFYGLNYALAGGPLDAEESKLWDDIVVAALQKSTYNMSGFSGPWLDIGTASEWAHTLAWDATYFRMTMKCP